MAGCDVTRLEIRRAFELKRLLGDAAAAMNSVVGLRKSKSCPRNYPPLRCATPAYAPSMREWERIKRRCHRLQNPDSHGVSVRFRPPAPTSSIDSGGRELARYAAKLGRERAKRI